MRFPCYVSEEWMKSKKNKKDISEYLILEMIQIPFSKHYSSFIKENF